MSNPDNLKLDIYILLKLFKIGNVLGLTPMFFEKKNKIRIRSWKIYVAILMIIYGSACILTLKWKSEQLSKEMKITEIILDCAQCISGLLFVMVCLTGSLIGSNYWKAFLSGIKEIEHTLNGTQFGVKKSLLLNNINIILYHMAFVFLYAYDNFILIQMGQTKIAYTYIIYRIGMYYQLFELIFLCKVVRMLKRRYDFLLECLNDTLTKNALPISPSVNQF
ncbi:hypothetical protein NQ318_000428 [Aromia moschata]|uniref:Gustatory receptor n=1 Tax=Aromia moschata TaxID=1265417 RepID=A0AAV8YSP6_9CUCU|nr:hypothetical protein NQ318_000428 [Aromia moschata]